MRSNFESRTILSACLDNSFVSPAEATRMWELCGEYAETLYGAPLSLRFLMGRDTLPGSNFSPKQ